jgi:hypothetical protein
MNAQVDGRDFGEGAEEFPDRGPSAINDNSALHGSIIGTLGGD